MIEPARYCRDIETYLCKKNDGHLIRIVGPAFEQVCGWAERGVPLKVACLGIDRYFERYYAKGGGRRPVRIEFCEADILDAFDDWRRAVGIPAGAEADPGEGGRRPALASHIDRVLARLRALEAPRSSDQFQQTVRTTVTELERMVEDARTVRGERRAAIVARLIELDRTLLETSVAAIDAGHAADLTREADSALAPFASRMSPDARARALDAAFQRLVREALGVPTLTYE
jgi:hypothetical protein